MLQVIAKADAPEWRHVFRGTKDTTVTTSGSRTITLTNRAPVRIQVDQWSTIAEARGDSYSGRDYARHQQALYRGECDTYILKVRRHSDAT